MKNILFTTLLVASLGATSAYANEVYSNNGVTMAVPSVSTEAAQNLTLCLESDAQLASSKAIRACSKAYKASIPSYNVRSAILTRRGVLQLSAGRFDKAARDFKTAGKLSAVNEFAYLGQGYAAMMNQDYAAAMQYFEDCKSHNTAAPLAYYGLAMTKELAGDKAGAFRAYQAATKLRPDWQAPLEELKRFQTST